MCNCPPAPPGPLSYITFGVLTTAGAVSLALRITTVIVGVRVDSPALNIIWALVTVGLAIAAACVAGRISIRKVRAEAARTRAELTDTRADLAATRAELGGIRSQMNAIEEQSWWVPADAEQTVELPDNVVAIRGRAQVPELRSS